MAIGGAAKDIANKLTQLNLIVHRDKAHRLGGGFFPLTGAAVG
jgi:hypothetical protein